MVAVNWDADWAQADNKTLSEALSALATSLGGNEAVMLECAAFALMPKDVSFE